MEPVLVRGVAIGLGRPKVIVPVLGETLDALLQEAAQVQGTPAQLVEWRVDWFAQARDHTQLLAAAAGLRERLGDLPLLATFRTAGEGGHQAISPEEYQTLVETLAASGLVDLMDLEVFSDADVPRLIAFCHGRNLPVILSNHDFDKTPPKEELIRRLAYMESLGGDIAKLAVMPQTPEDVLTLLSATWTRSRTALRPVVTMSMGALGGVSRVTGELFGSALTFGCAGRASAPGQLEAHTLEDMLERLSPSR